MGGLLSLFIGFSFISGIELLYFFTFRLFYKIRSHTAGQQLVSPLHNGRDQNINVHDTLQPHFPTSTQHVNMFHYSSWRNSNALHDIAESH